MAVSENGGTPKSSILIGISLINHPFWGTTIFGNTHIVDKTNQGRPKKTFYNYKLVYVCICKYVIYPLYNMVSNSEIYIIFQRKKILSLGYINLSEYITGIPREMLQRWSIDVMALCCCFFVGCWLGTICKFILTTKDDEGRDLSTKLKHCWGFLGLVSCITSWRVIHSFLNRTHLWWFRSIHSLYHLLYSSLL